MEINKQEVLILLFHFELFVVKMKILTQKMKLLIDCIDASGSVYIE